MQNSASAVGSGARRAPVSRAQRYASGIVTIQIRNVPDGVHRIYQMRAAAAGMSLQVYLLVELVRNARLRPPADLVEEVENRLLTEGSEGFARGSSAGLVRADREAH
jgi:antitoxin FitA